MSFEENVPNERLRRARHLKGWTQNELAETLGTDFETVSRWERGITVPGAYFRKRLCTAFGTTAEELGLIPNAAEPLIPHTSPCVFLSSAHVDAQHEVVIFLRSALVTQGITVLSSRTVQRQGGEHKRKTLQEAICAARVILLIVSPETRSSRHVQDVLKIAKIYRSCVCAIWIEGEHWQDCIPRDRVELFTTIDARKNIDATVLNEIVAQLEPVWLASNKAEFSPSLIDESTASSEPRNPYKGLNAFHSQDRHDFFGRDTLIRDLTETLKISLLAEKDDAQGARLLAVVGPSGSGKSSVVMAGLLPRLQAGVLAGSQDWVYLDPIVPGAHPLESLALTLARQLPNRSLKTIHDDLEDDSTGGLHLIASYLRKRSGTQVVLFVDQFEEVFTQTISEDERQQFLDLLVTAVIESQGPTFVILTLRADFYDRPMHYPDLSRLIEDHHRPVLPMDLKELREAIEKPAGLPDVRLTFEGDLAGDLLFEVHGQTGALPLLQFALDHLFQRRSNHQLVLQAYHEMGGVKGALAKHAEQTYLALHSEEHRRLARALFLRLIDPGITEQDTTRRRATLSELTPPNAKQAATLRELIEIFTTARLLTTNESVGITTVEVSHEALIREWPRLANWLREGREDIHLQQILTKNVAEWEQRGKPKDRLYRGSQLKEMQAWSKRNIPSSNEVAFFRASALLRIRSRVIVLAILLLLIVMAGVVAQLLLLVVSRPNPPYVTNLKDQGSGSLRQAIDTAIPGSTITFAPTLSGTIVLTSNDLYITKNVSIRGPGAGILTISNGGSSSSIHVLSVASLSISGLAFKNSESLNQIFIDNMGQLTLTSSTISGNTVYEKGSIINNSGTLTLINSIISNNVGYASGGINNSGHSSGGVNNSDNGILHITNSIISDNITQTEGGGVNNNGILDITNSTISDNNADAGGGISSTGSLILTNSTVSDNTALTLGGGIAISYPGSFNHTSFPDSAYGIDFCTIYGNTTTKGQGGGIAFFGISKYAFRPDHRTSLSVYVGIGESIVAGNDAHADSNISGRIWSRGYNLFQNVSGVTITNQQPTDVRVGPLDDLKIDPKLTGRPPKTHALLYGSPAIDQIPRDACNIATDQRGVQRPKGLACDIGAYEYITPP